MKELKHLIVLLIVSSSLSINFLDFKHFQPEEDKSHLGGRTPMEEIVLGKGYSSDSKQLANVACYSATSSKNGQFGVVDFVKSVSYEQLKNDLELDFELKGGYGEFAAGISASYMKNVRDTKTKISFSFYAKHTQTVHYNYSYGQDKLLNEEGKAVLMDAPERFSTICGDYLITSYEEGSILIMSIVMEFTSKEEKESFAGGLNFSYSSYAELSFKIKGANDRIKQNTSIRIYAEQFGGETTQLNTIIDKSMIKCSLIDMQECDNVALAIVNYAANNYPKQFPNNVGKYTPLGKHTSKHVKTFGLKGITSSVTEEVILKREALIKAFRKIDYYKTKITDFSLSYPKFEKSAQILNEFKNYIDRIHYAFLDGDAAKKCWNDIPDCVTTANSLLSRFNDKYVDDFYDTHFSNLKYSHQFILRGEKDKNTCLIRNFKWTQDRNYVIKMQPGLQGEKALTVEGYRVIINEINQGRILIALNKEVFPYITSNILVTYQERDNDLIGEIICTDRVQYESLNYEYRLQMYGSKFVSKYFFEKYSDSVF